MTLSLMRTFLFIIFLFSLTTVSHAEEWQFPVLTFLSGKPIQFESGSYIRLGGRIHGDANYYEGALNNKVGGNTENDYFMRRIRLVGVAQLGPDWFLYAHVPFESDADDDVLDAYLIYKGLGPSAWLRVGRQKETIGLDWLNGAAVLPLIERSAVTRALVQERSKGISMMGNRSGWLYMLGAFDTNNFDSSSHQWAFTGRLLYKSERANGDVWHLGLNTSHSDEETGKVNVQPGIQKVRSVDQVSTGTLDSDGKNLWGGEYLHIKNNWHINAEAYWAEYHRPGLTDHRAWGGYVSGGWIFSGEKRQYKSTYATMGSVSPKGKAGALEMVGRWSSLDLQDNGQGNEADIFTLGLNWFANNYVIIQGNVVYADYDKAPDGETASGVSAVGDHDGWGASVRAQLNW